MLVPPHAINEVFLRLRTALKVGGWLYASFKYGNGEVIRNGRLFNSYNDENFRRLLQTHADELEIARFWRTADLRPDQDENTWLNVLLRKQ